MTVRAYAAWSLVGLSAWLALEAADVAGFTTSDRSVLLVAATVVPLFQALHLDAMYRFAGRTVRPVAWSHPVQGVGALGFAAGEIFGVTPLAAVGGVAFAAGAIVYAVAVMKAAPKGGLVTDDPLTKGDDACFKHVVFAHRFLALGALVLALVPSVGFADQTWAVRLLVSAQHILVIGFGLLSAYGISHLWVPRFSGVPAIAAGAIKGELHTTLLGLTGLIIGFLTGIRGLMAGLGFFVFVGFFTFMGVLGANMMRNKSKTQRVTPEFVYIPWTFTAIFWLISAVLMGLFLNTVPDVLADRYGDLRHLHIAAGLIGGFVQLAMGLLTRIVPTETGSAPPRFQGSMRLAFFAFNGGLTLWLYGAFTGGRLELVGLALLAASMMAFAGPLQKLMAKPSVASA